MQSEQFMNVVVVTCTIAAVVLLGLVLFGVIT